MPGKWEFLPSCSQLCPPETLTDLGPHASSERRGGPKKVMDALPCMSARTRGGGVGEETPKALEDGQARWDVQKSIDLSAVQSREKCPAPASEGRAPVFGWNPLHLPNTFFPFWLILLRMISVICDQKSKRAPITCIYNSTGKSLGGVPEP